MSTLPPRKAFPDSREGAGRYELKRELAAGGMGTIFLADDRLGQREVAYKLLTVSNEKQRALRTTLFRREYDILTQLPHPNIVEVYDYGYAGDTPYYVMELLGGADLASVAPLPYREACRVLRDIASALALVHTRRFVHRDVSPGNVRLTADGKAKLLDFGALVPFGPTRELVGTAGFVAPECLRAEPLDQRTDLFSLGAVAYWTLTRRRSTAARTVDELVELMKVGDEPLVPPSAYVRGIPSRLDELVLSLLAPDPLDRPANAAYVIDALTSIADLEPEVDERRVAQSYLAHPPLCGRAAALDTLQQTIDATPVGLGGNVIVESDAGLGRSAMVDAAAQYAQLGGAMVVRARGDAADSAFRLARTLVEAVTGLYPDLEPPQGTPSSMLLRGRSETRAATPDATEAAERQATLVRSASAMLLEASRRAPLVLVVDDLHLSDGASIGVLAALALSPERPQLTLVMSRLAGATAGDTVTFEKLLASATRLALAPLTRADVGELVQALFGGVPNSLALAHWLYGQSGGNVATTLDLTRLLLQRGLLRYTLGTFTLPDHVDADLSSFDLGSAILARLGDLSPRVEQLARTLCLHPDALTPEQLAAAEQLPLPEVLRALEELVQRGIAAKTDAAFVFVGSGLRTALAQTLSEEERKGRHLALARALLAHPGDPVLTPFDASQHLLRAGHDEEALKLVDGLAHNTLWGHEVSRRSALLEELLAASRARGQSPERNLSLMLPLAASGFIGKAQVHDRYVDPALALLSRVCGMSLARSLGSYVGGRLALVIGLVTATVRRRLRFRHDRLGSMTQLLGYFLGLVCDSIATHTVRGDAATCRRHLDWLQPLAVLSPSSAGHVMREFCLATVELATGRLDRAAGRFAALTKALSEPIKSLEHVQNTLYYGSLNGQGIAQAGLGSKLALPIADELAKDMFFASHAEVIRVSYHGIRGEREEAELHRERAEQLALRGGAAWSSSFTLTTLTSVFAAGTEDAIALVRTIAELERYLPTAPKLHVVKTISEGWLEHVRGRTESALAIFDSIIDHEDAQGVPSLVVCRALHATLLNTLGMHSRAEHVCLRLIQAPDRQGEQTIGMRMLQRELAVARAGLGRFDEAAALAEKQIEDAVPLENPLELGSAHRDRARIALLAHDAAAFDLHFTAMTGYFRSTRNPCLVAQCESLLARAVRSGLRADARPTRPLEAAVDTLDDQTYVEEAPSQDTFVDASPPKRNSG